MLIRYAYGKEGQIFYKFHSNIVPRVGETVIFDEIDYNNCTERYDFINGKQVHTGEYIIDSLDSDMFTVTDVCYCIYKEDIEVDVTVKDYDYGYDNNEYLENLAKDVNVLNDYNR